MIRSNEGSNSKFKSISKEFYRNNKFNLIIAVISTILIGASNIFTAYLFKNLADVAILGSLKELKKLIYIAIIYLILYVGISLIKRKYLNEFVYKAVKQYKNGIFSNIMYSNKIKHFEESISSHFISVLTNDITSIENNYLLGTINIIYQIVLFILGLLSMIYLNYKLTLCILICCIIPILVNKIFEGRLVNSEEEVSKKNSNFVSVSKDLLTGLPVIKSFQSEKEMNELFISYNNDTEITKNNYRKLNNLINISMFSSTFIISVVLSGVGVYFTIKGSITLGTIIAFIQLLDYVVNPAGQIGNLIARRSAAKILIEKNEWLLSDENIENNTVNQFDSGITFKNVTFSYDNKRNQLDNFNYKFIKNKSYAIVGLSGSGKSTIVKLLLKNFEEYIGYIYLDNTNIKDLEDQSIYNIISYIQQNVFVFNDSIINNITLYRDYDKSLIDRIIDEVGLSYLINEKGYNYLCGEGGNNLSGGEKQRISIARAMISNHKIIIADEATSSLDNFSDLDIQRTILNLPNTTKIIITHRMNKEILEEVDDIIVMNNGQVVESGDYNVLYNKKGLFYSLYNINNAGNINKENDNSTKETRGAFTC